VDPEDLPTSDQLADDLARLVHELPRFARIRLPSLEALPSVRLWQPPSPRAASVPETDRRMLAIEFLISDITERHADAAEKAALQDLFTFGDRDKPLKDRQAAAARALAMSSGDSFRQHREGLLLRTAADEICRYELWESIQRADRMRDGLAMGATWARLIEQDWSVVISPEPPHEQLWEFRHLYTALTPVALPVVVVDLPWSGTGPHNRDSVSILSGPDETSPEHHYHRHRLLDIVPYPDHGGMYFWHLGRGMPRGAEVELRFTQRFVDEANTFIPTIARWTRHDSLIRSLKLRANVPDELVRNPTGLITRMGTFEFDDGSWHQNGVYAPSEVIALTRGDDGYFTFAPHPVQQQCVYQIWWGPRPVPHP
jgi:hypothetical protein